MSKPIITQEQADAIEGIKWALAGFGEAVLFEVLKGNYEIIPQFKIGDWVYVEVPKKELPNVFKVMNAEGYSVNLDRLYGNHKKSDIRHATPEEIAEEKERRLDVKLNGLLSGLNKDKKYKLL